MAPVVRLVFPVALLVLAAVMLARLVFPVSYLALLVLAAVMLARLALLHYRPHLIVPL